MNFIDRNLFLSPMRTILVVEDENEPLLSILGSLGSIFKVVVATTIEDLGGFVTRYAPDLIDAAIFDAQLGTHQTSFRWLASLRDAGFTGPILANSKTDNEKLLQAGASAACNNKNSAGEQIISMMLDQLVEWIPIPIRNLINIFEIEKWDQLVALMSKLSPEEITKLQGVLGTIQEPVPSRYLGTSLELGTAIQQVQDGVQDWPTLEPEYQKVLDDLKQHLQ